MKVIILLTSYILCSTVGAQVSKWNNFSIQGRQEEARKDQSEKFRATEELRRQRQEDQKEKASEDPQLKTIDRPEEKEGQID